MKESVGSGLVDEDASKLNSVDGDEGLDRDSSSVEVSTGLVRRNG